MLPVLQRGKHQRTKSLLYDEDFMSKCGEWLHMQPPNQRSPQRFQQHLNNEVLPLVTGAVQANVSESTARRWMQHVGYRYGLYIGKNNEGYWTSDHVIKQVQDQVVLAFNTLHPFAKGLFTFDQSTNHAAFAFDALRATNMNLKPGGNQAILRPGQFADGSVQHMVFDANHERKGEAKGLQQVLLERGIDVKQLKMPLDCKIANVDPSQGDVLMCCARHCMASQPDFRAQVSILEETIEKAGHICLFLPKYHCELNPIESFWGAAKRFAQGNCDYSFDGLKACVPRSLQSVQLSSIRKFFCRCAHFIEAYYFGCDYELTKFAHKKYKSHRRIPQTILQEKQALLDEMRT